MANKIYYDLKNSPFYCNKGEFKFYFSSAFHRNNFINKVDEYIKIENKKFNAKYKGNFDLSYILTISYYKKIENRGFLAYYKNKKIDPIINLALD